MLYFSKEKREKKKVPTTALLKGRKSRGGLKKNMVGPRLGGNDIVFGVSLLHAWKCNLCTFYLSLLNFAKSNQLN